MAWDIFGDHLERGHCEVHPWVHQEYPCQVCYMQKEQHDRDQEEAERYYGEMAQHHYEEMAQAAQYFEHGSGI